MLMYVVTVSHILAVTLLLLYVHLFTKCLNAASGYNKVSNYCLHINFISKNFKKTVQWLIGERNNFFTKVRYDLKT